jgi:hypothetical protein
LDLLKLLWYYENQSTLTEEDFDPSIETMIGVKVESVEKYPESINS